MSIEIFLAFIFTYWQVILLILTCYLFLILTSGMLLQFILSHVSTKGINSASKGDIKEPPTEVPIIPSEKRIRDTGVIVGKCENLLIPTLIVLHAYTALAIIFTAKAIVRAEDMKNQNTLYFLAGTMINFTYSVLIGVVIKIILFIYLGITPFSAPTGSV